MKIIFYLIAFFGLMFYLQVLCFFNKRDIDYTDEHIWITKLIAFSKYFYGWKIDVNKSKKLSNIFDKIKSKNKLLYISNHPTSCDFLINAYVTSTYFKEYKKIYVMKDIISSFPGFSKYLKSNCIITDKNPIEKIKERLNRVKPDEKVIVIIYPEGNVMYDKTLKERDEFTALHNIETHKNTLIPKCRGLFDIYKLFDPDYTIQSCITFKDDLEQKKGKTYMQLALFDIASHAVIDLSLFNHKKYKKYSKKDDYEKFKKCFFKYWLKFDKSITKKYENYRRELES
jgi:1-acyl-sn-glycerol-3-phosphate acyltransferase